MQNNKNIPFSRSDERSVRPSFYEVLDLVKSQVDFSEIKPTKSAAALELCKIIAEVMVLNPERETQIGRDMIPVSIVQEIYASIGIDHIELVIDNFRQQRELIRNKKAYLRAALYNSAFEIEAHYTNLVKHDTE